MDGKPTTIEVVRSGGVAGVSRRLGPVDLGSLAAADVRSLVGLIRRAEALISAGDAAAGSTIEAQSQHSDPYQYDVFVTDDRGRWSFRVVESTTAAELASIAREIAEVLRRCIRTHP